MLDRKKIDLKITSKDYKPSEQSCFSFDLNLSLLPISSNEEIEETLKKIKDEPENKDERQKNVFVMEVPQEKEKSDEKKQDQWEVDEDEEPDKIEDIEIEEDEVNKHTEEPDILEIMFKGSDDIPADVESHIQSRIGQFEKSFNEETGETVLTFEVNFNHIDQREVFKSYQKFFSQNEDLNSKFEVKFSKNGSLKELLTSFEERTEIPLILHLLEKGMISVNIDSPEYLLENTVKFLKQNFNEQTEFLEYLLHRFQSISGTMTLGDLNKFSKSFWKNLELDQTQNFGGFFDVWKTPLLKFIFGKGERTLRIKGTILKFLSYEFNMQILDFKEFLEELSQKFK